MHMSKFHWECHSILPGTPGLPYYCTPLVYVPNVIGVLAVWWHNKNKNKNQNFTVALLLHTTRVRSHLLGRVGSVVALQTSKQTNNGHKSLQEKERMLPAHPWVVWRGLTIFLGATKRAFSTSWLRFFCLGICHFSNKSKTWIIANIPNQIDWHLKIQNADFVCIKLQPQIYALFHPAAEKLWSILPPVGKP